MSENKTKKAKPILDVTKLHYTDAIPKVERKHKNVTNWLPILNILMANKTANNVLKLDETECSVVNVQNQIIKTIKKNKLTGIIVNRRNIDKKQTLFVSYKKQ